MPDRVLSAEVARVLQAESAGNGEMLAWIVTSGDSEWTARPVGKQHRRAALCADGRDVGRAAGIAAGRRDTIGADAC